LGIFQDFSDYKQCDSHINQDILYFKLIAKEILFISKIPCLSSLEATMVKKSKPVIPVCIYVMKKKVLQLPERFNNDQIIQFIMSSKPVNAKATVE